MRRPNPPAGPGVRLVVCDMDGTLLDAHGAIPEEFWPLLQDMSARGIVFAPASGRQYATLARMFDRAPAGLAYIAENGTLVIREGEVLSTTYLDRPTASWAIDAVRRAAHKRDLGLVLCGRCRAYIERRDEDFVRQVAPYYAELAMAEDLTHVTEDVLKVAIYDFADAEACVTQVFSQLQLTHQVAISGKHWIDIMNPDANKGQAVRALQNKLDIGPAQTVVFGDYLNDLEMLDTAEMSFAMANAHPLIRERARYAAPSHRDHGVITVLSQLLQN